MEITKGKRALIGIGAVILIALAGMLLLAAERNKAKETTEPVALKENGTEQQIFVDIKGAVISSGVYTLPEGARVQDAIQAAGGLKETADLISVNQAAELHDGDELYIPVAGDRSGKPVLSNRSGGTTAENALENGSGTAGGKVNINTATLKELDSLPGIGEKTAQKIIAYREKQQFEVIEDIMKVQTIGEAKFNEIKDWITTGN